MLPQLANHGRLSVLRAVGQFEQPATSQDDDFFGRGRSITAGLFVVGRGFIKRNRRPTPSVNTAAFCGIYLGRRPVSGMPTIRTCGRWPGGKACIPAIVSECATIRPNRRIRCTRMNGEIQVATCTSCAFYGHMTRSTQSGPLVVSPTPATRRSGKRFHGS